MPELQELMGNQQFCTVFNLSSNKLMLLIPRAELSNWILFVFIELLFIFTIKMFRNENAALPHIRFSLIFNFLWGKISFKIINTYEEFHEIKILTIRVMRGIKNGSKIQLKCTKRLAVKKYIVVSCKIYIIICPIKYLFKRLTIFFLFI